MESCLAEVGMDLSFRKIAVRLCIALSRACEIFKRFESTGDVHVQKGDWDDSSTKK